MRTHRSLPAILSPLLRRRGASSSSVACATARPPEGQAQTFPSLMLALFCCCLFVNIRIRDRCRAIDHRRRSAACTCFRLNGLEAHVTPLSSPRMALRSTNRCRGLELPERALIVAARMLHNARLSGLLESADSGAKPMPLTLSDIANNPNGAVAKVSSLNRPGAAAAGASTALVKIADGAGGGQGKAQRKQRKPGDPPVTREEFERVLAVCCLPYSLTWADAAYELCMGEVGAKRELGAAAASAAALGAMGSYGAYGKGKAKNKKRKITRTREEFWAAFGAALVNAREDCDDLMCG